MTELRVKWDAFETVAQCRAAVWNTVRARDWESLGLQWEPEGDRVLAVEKEDGIHLYLREQYSEEPENADG